MNAFELPMRPLKFLLAVDITFSPSDGTPLCVPTHGPQPAVTTAAPALTRVCIIPASMAFRYVSLEAGATMNLTSGLTVFPLTMSAAIFRSSNLPFVHVPRNASSIFVPNTSEMPHTLSTLWGFAIWGSKSAAS